MIEVVCCMCNTTVYWKPGYSAEKSHGFCQSCFDVYCKENGIDPIEISVPKGAVLELEREVQRSW